MIKKMTISLSTILLFGIGSSSQIESVKAEENKNLQLMEEQHSRIQLEILQRNVEIFQVKDELQRLNEQILRVEQAIKDNTEQIVQTEEKITLTEAEISDLQKEITVIKEKIIKRNEILKKRATSFQESGGNVSYLDVLLGSVNFGDFIDRITAVSTIVKADQNLIDSHQQDKKIFEEKHEEIKNKLADLQNMKTELEGMQAQILEQKNQNDILKQELERKEQEKRSEQTNLQKQENELEKELIHIDPEWIYKSNLFSNATVQTVIMSGFKYIGNSVYVFGGGRNEYDVENGRFDCSAFVHWAFSQANIKVGASTESLKNEGAPIDIKEVQPGDLVFFDTYKKDGHVGIYLGAGKFIGSQSSTGVAIADMTSGYWLDTFNGRVNRIIEQEKGGEN